MCTMNDGIQMDYTHMLATVMGVFKFNDLQPVRIMTSYPLFPQFLFIYARPPVLSTMINCIIMLSQLL